MATLTRGTKEYLLVDLVDQSGELTDLIGTNPRFDVVGPGTSGTARYTEESALIDPDTSMRIRCMIDTANPSLWPTGVYKLYPKLDTLPEIPRLGPFTFTVVE